MKQVICAVLDSAVKSFMQPIFAPTIGSVARSFGDEVNRPESPMHAHPEDYVLYEIGEFDSEFGKFTQCEPRIVARAKDVLRRAE